MSLSENEAPWVTYFENQDLSVNKSFINSIGKDPHGRVCLLSDLPQPCPQRASFDGGFGKRLVDDDEFEEHHLEQALEEMAYNGELEKFLRENTVSLREIQDDISIRYGGATESCDHQPKPRARRHSIGSVDEIIKCPFPGCDKIFNRMYNFKSHFKIHSGEKPFQCGHCEMSFARCHDLKRHEKIHNKDNQNLNKCDFCQKKFSRPDALNRHIKLNACQYLLLKRDI